MDQHDFLKMFQSQDIYNYSQICGILLSRLDELY